MLRMEELERHKEFDFVKSESWKLWKWRFERCRGASELAIKRIKSQKQQVFTLIYMMGTEAKSVEKSFVYEPFRGRCTRRFCKSVLLISCRGKIGFTEELSSARGS